MADARDIHDHDQLQALLADARLNLGEHVDLFEQARIVAINDEYVLVRIEGTADWMNSVVPGVLLPGLAEAFAEASRRLKGDRT